MTVLMLTNVSATGLGTIMKPLGKTVFNKTSQGVFQGDFHQGVGTIQLLGRADPANSFAVLATVTDNTPVAIQLMNEMVANVSVYTSGALSASLNI